MSQKEFLANRRQHITRKLHRLWGQCVMGQYIKREWEEFQDDLIVYFAEVDKLVEEHGRKSSTDQKS